MNKPAATRLIEWRLYDSRGWLSRLIGFRSNGAAGEFTHVDVVDPETGWLWGAHSDAMTLPARAIPAQYRDYGLTVTTKGLHIPSGFYPRPPNYQAKIWRRVVAFRLAVPEVQFGNFWLSTHRKVAAPYDTRGLLDTYVLGRNWREPGAWYCSEAQADSCEFAHIIKPVEEDAVEPAEFAEIVTQRGASRVNLPVPVPELPLAA